MNWFSQLGQDKFLIEKIFNKKEKGFFVDVGAHDGEYLSNTKCLENLKWKGICIEPSAASVNLAKSRDDNCKIVSGCCVSEGKLSGKIVRFRQFNPNEISVTLFEDLHEEPYWPKDLERGNNYEDKLKKCKTLNEILIENSAPKKIDYISIDTQGCEWLVVKDFPLGDWNVKVFTIANDMFQGGEKEDNRNKTKSFMESNGYKLTKTFSLKELDKNNWGKNFEDEIIEDLYVKQDN